MSRFAPQSPAGISQVEMAYQALRDMPTGTIIPYAELPYRGRVAQLKVRKLMEREQKRSIATAREDGICVGWKIVAGVEQLDIVERDSRRSLRSLGRALHSAENVDRRELSGEEQVRADAVLIKTRIGYHDLRSTASRRLGVADVVAWRARNGDIT